MIQEAHKSISNKKSSARLRRDCPPAASETQRDGQQGQTTDIAAVPAAASLAGYLAPQGASFFAWVILLAKVSSQGTAAVQWLDAACKQQSPTCLLEGPSIRTQHLLALEPCM